MSHEKKLKDLIDRLQKHSEWKYPNRKWTNEFYYECTFQWMNKIEELERQVLKLEEEMKCNCESKCLRYVTPSK